MKTRVFTWLLVAVTLMVIIGAKSAFAAPSERDLILLDARAMTASETARAQALARLQARPRKQVVNALRELLKAPETQSAALAAISAMDLSEVLPDLRMLCEKEDDWHLFATVNHLISEKNVKARADFSNLYMRRLTSGISSPSKMAVLDGLGKFGGVLSGKIFSQLLQDESDGVRESVVTEFLTTHEKLSTPEQIARFRESFRAKPYQVRLAAMKYFVKLPLSARRNLKAAVEKNLCRQEIKTQVKPTCQELSKSTGRGGKK